MTLFSKEWLIMEAKSFLHTFLAYLAVDGFQLWHDIFAGVWQQDVLWLILLLVARSAVKALLVLLFPKMFSIPSTPV